MYQFFGLLLSLVVSTSLFAETPWKFSTEATYPPFASINESGEFEGIEVKIIQAISEKLQQPVTFSHQPFDSLIIQLKLNKIDVAFGGMDITPTRRKQVRFSDPLFTKTIGFIGNEQFSFSQSTLKGKTIAVQKGSTFEAYLKKHFKKVMHIKSYPNLQQALNDLSLSRVDGVLGDFAIFIHWQTKFPAHPYVLSPLSQLTQEDEEFLGKHVAVAFSQKFKDKDIQAFNQALKALNQEGKISEWLESVEGIEPWQ